MVSQYFRLSILTFLAFRATVTRISNQLHYNSLTENDIRSFLQEAPSRRFAVSSTLITSVLIAVITSGLIFAGLNAQSFFMINSIGSENVAAAPVSVPTVSPSTAPIAVAAAEPAPTPTPTPVTPSIPNNTLAIAGLGISAPITWSTPLDIKVQSKLLNAGLVHIAGTALPGEKGMAAISGHSSNYPWIKSSYNSVFAPLVKAKIGDTVEINYNNTLYTYKITKKYEVKPSQVSVLEDHAKTGLLHDHLNGSSPHGRNRLSHFISGDDHPSQRSRDRRQRVPGGVRAALQR